MKLIWNKTWGDGRLYSLAVDSSDNIYATGADRLYKINSFGDILWNLTSTLEGGSNALCLDSSENIYVSGGISYWDDTGLIGCDSWLSKYDTEGNKLWNFTWYTPGYDYWHEIATDSNNDVYICGEYNSQYCIMKFDHQGNFQWNHTWRDPYYRPDSASAIYIDHLDNIYLGASSQRGFDYVFDLHKFNTSGSQIWETRWITPNPIINEYDIICDPSGNIYATGGRSSLFLLKYDDSGVLQWEVNSQPSNLYLTLAIELDDLGNIYCGGVIRYEIDLNYYYDIILMMYNSSGSFQCSYQWGSHNQAVMDSCDDIVLDSSGGLYLCGYSSNWPDYKFTLLKFKIPAMFEVLYPNSNQIFGVSPPNFGIEKLTSNIASTWYSINHLGKYMYTGENGTINKIAWDSCESGEVVLTFFANNTLGSLTFEEVIVYKDTTAPNITLITPIPHRLYGNVSPCFNILVDSPDLDTLWYSLDNGINNFTATVNLGTIDQNAWNSCVNGSVDITFYANDTVGNEALLTAQVYKDFNAPCIKINSPEIFELYGKNLVYDLELIGNNIDKMWYTLNDGEKNYFYNDTGIINGSIWEDCLDGLVHIEFFVNNTDSKETSTDIYVYQDTTIPEITLIKPIEYQFFNNISPTFNISISDIHLNDTWYTINSGLNNYFYESTGVIDQNEWSSIEDGAINITFFAIDSLNNVNSEEIIVYKDTINPSIEIENPIQHQLFFDEIPEFNVSISDPNLDETWYTLNEGAKIYFNESIGSIDQQVWESCNDGNVNITFWANDFVGNINQESVIVRKNIDSKEAYAIIIGISNYPGSNDDLEYCDDDAIAIYNMLINDYNFKPSNIIYLQDSSATKADISNAFDTISALSDPNDVFFFYYSGHGGQGTYTTQGNWDVETLHPYWNNDDRIWSVSHPGAIYMRVHFERFQTEDYYDYVLCGSAAVAQGYYYEELTGNLGYNFWTSYIPVSRYYIRFISDFSNTDWGFKIDKYEAILSDGTHYLCSYDSIPSNPGAYYMDTLLDSKLDSISCADKYVVVDACNSGGLIPEVGDIGRYIMTACGSNEESLETSLLEHGIFTYFLLESQDNANDGNGDGVISMEECYSYVYSNTRSYSGSFGSEYRYSPQESDGISGEAVLYPSLGSLWINPVDNQLSYSFHLYGHGRLKTLNLTVCSISPTITLKTTNIMNVSTSPTGFGYYNGTIDLPGGYIAGGIQLLAEIEGNTIIVINITIGDSDEDGLTDFFEILEGLDPNSNDTDSDGLLDGEEINIYGTNPLLDDTDFDGLTDYDEINIHNTDPLLDDTDSDGVLDGEEINVYGTDPLIADSDSDGLIDGDEINLHLTDPLNNDTDSDNLLDSEEILVYYTDPLNDDTDIDGLTDYGEIFIYSTNPLLNDTDSEGLTDGDEVNTYGTNPLLEDTDSDGLTDYEEVVTYGTNPLLEDTDSDTIPDAWEVNNLLDPLTNDTALDPDNDLLTNLGEYQFDTQPFNNDTDSDGLLDGEEVYTYNTEPLEEDTDSDGLLDGEEVDIYNTEPLEEDTDSDGLLDGEEVYDFNTNPLSGDTDSDTMPDGWEVINSLNPLVNDTALDPDNDLLINILEFQHDTNPQNPDTDGDNWTDGDEVLEYDTDPLDPDDHPSRKSPAIPGYSVSLLMTILSVCALILIKKFRKCLPLS